MRLRESRFAILLILLALIALSTVSAQNIAIEKSVESDVLPAGAILVVRIGITNLADSDVELTVQEVVVGAEPVHPHSLVVHEPVPGMIGVRLPYYKWQLTLAAGESQDILYSVRPSAPGEYVIAPTRVFSSAGQFKSNSVSLWIACDGDGVCAAGENYMNCAADCASGSADGMCDFIADARCDPDCTVEADSDCAVSAPLSEATAFAAAEPDGREFWHFPLGWPLLLLLILILVPVSGVLTMGGVLGKR